MKKHFLLLCLALICFSLGDYIAFVKYDNYECKGDFLMGVAVNEGHCYWNYMKKIQNIQLIRENENLVALIFPENGCKGEPERKVLPIHEGECKRKMKFMNFKEIHAKLAYVTGFDGIHCEKPHMFLNLFFNQKKCIRIKKKHKAISIDDEIPELKQLGIEAAMEELHKKKIKSVKVDCHDDNVVVHLYKDKKCRKHKKAITIEPDTCKNCYKFAVSKKVSCQFFPTK